MGIKNCVYCGSELIEVKGTQKEYIEDKTINIINVPFVRCNKCNEEYIVPKVMKNINKIVLDTVDTMDETSITVDYDKTYDCKE
ncbi:YgiT-type zinc finger protein [Clostridium perfringens]|uniref:YgiT-type zinc finger protein n=1 Tax=Clostridium perfringens TaxID=1502 RepID=UPI003754C9E4